MDKRTLLEAKVESIKAEIARKQAVILKLKNVDHQLLVVEKKKPGLKFRGKSSAASTTLLKRAQPYEETEDKELEEAIQSTLPPNYNFEIKKTLWRIKRMQAKKVAIQFPEGLLLFACPISDLLEKYASVQCVIFSDVTYGACCIDDFAARALGCDLLVHYGHSCLVPIDPNAETQVMYVFVDITFEIEHLVECIKLEFPPEVKLGLMGTIQFSSTLYLVKAKLDSYFTLPIQVPQVKPLSGGEVLGCTAPDSLGLVMGALVFVADGRFHLESCMIANPTLAAYRYDPFAKLLTREYYDFEQLHSTRHREIARASEKSKMGVILGTLGRQGNPKLLQRILDTCKGTKWQVVVILLSELSSAKLALMEKEIEVWVQIACPRLSMDWGEAFSSKPLLTPYECFVLLNQVQWKETSYPQDYYKKGSGPWTNYFD